MTGPVAPAPASSGSSAEQRNANLDRLADVLAESIALSAFIVSCYELNQPPILLSEAQHGAIMDAVLEADDPDDFFRLFGNLSLPPFIFSPNQMAEIRRHLATMFSIVNTIGEHLNV